MSRWHPKEDDVWGYVSTRMEESYQGRERPKCSRDDFADGYLTALRDFLPKSAFKPGRPEPEPADEARP